MLKQFIRTSPFGIKYDFHSKHTSTQTFTIFVSVKDSCLAIYRYSNQLSAQTFYWNITFGIKYDFHSKHTTEIFTIYVSAKDSHRVLAFLIWATSWENLLMPYANIKGADQPAHPRSLISAFVVCCLDSIIPLVSVSEMSSLYLASVPEQVGLSLPLSQIPKTGFLIMWLICEQHR